jgi:hypothetical protein
MRNPEFYEAKALAYHREIAAASEMSFASKVVGPDEILSVRMITPIPAVREVMADAGRLDVEERDAVLAASDAVIRNRMWRCMTRYPVPREVLQREIDHRIVHRTRLVFSDRADSIALSGLIRAAARQAARRLLEEGRAVPDDMDRLVRQTENLTHLQRALHAWDDGTASSSTFRLEHTAHFAGEPTRIWSVRSAGNRAAWNTPARRRASRRRNSTGTSWTARAIVPSGSCAWACAAMCCPRCSERRRWKATMKRHD